MPQELELDSYFRVLEDFDNLKNKQGINLQKLSQLIKIKMKRELMM